MLVCFLVKAHSMEDPIDLKTEFLAFSFFSAHYNFRCIVPLKMITVQSKHWAIYNFVFIVKVGGRGSAGFFPNTFPLFRFSTLIWRCFSENFQDIVPAVLPFYHIFGISALILTSLINGCKIISLRKFEPKKYVDVIKNEKVRNIYNRHHHLT